jgi:hypothetical protein
MLTHHVSTQSAGESSSSSKNERVNKRSTGLQEGGTEERRERWLEGWSSKRVSQQNVLSLGERYGPSIRDTLLGGGLSTYSEMDFRPY